MRRHDAIEADNAAVAVLERQSAGVIPVELPTEDALFGSARSE
jgi:hypothetical protein